MNYCRNTNDIREWVSPKNEWQTIAEYILFLKQSKAYDYVKPFCNDKCILDYGCGTGYGVMSVSENANSIIGIDINKQIIDHCKEKYQKTNVSFKQINAEYPLPFDNGVFDVVVSFQVIEHLPDVQRYLHELKRLLKDKGLLFITTPNRYYRLFPFEKPWNPEHIREYSQKSLDNALKRSFSNVKILGVHGNDEVDSVERKRVYRSPMKHLLGIVLPKSVISFVQARRVRVNISTVNKKQLIAADTLNQKFGLADFTINEYTNRCLDLMAVCQK